VKALSSEQYLIAAALTHPATVLPKLTGVVEPEHFATIANETIWGALLEAYETGYIDRGHVAEILRRSGSLRLVGGEDALEEAISAVGNVAGIERHAARVVEASVRRRLARLAAKIEAAAKDDTSTLDELSVMADEAGSLLRKAEAEGAETIVAALSRSVAEALDPTRNARNVRSGIGDLDDLLEGMAPGTLTVVGGRPSQGKSALGTTVLGNLAWAKKSALLVSLEMNSFECSLRMASAETGIPLTRLLRPEPGMPFDDDEHSKLADAGKSFSGPIAIWCPDYMPSFRQIANQAERHADKHGRIDLLMVDYVQLVDTDHLAKRYRSREQEVSWLSRNFKSLARRLDCSVFLLAQLNRDSTKGGKPRRPQLSDLRESGALEQDADQVLFVHRPGFYDYEAGGMGEISDPDEVVVAKNRNGQTGVVRLEYRGEYTRWQERQRGTSYEVGG